MNPGQKHELSVSLMRMLWRVCQAAQAALAACINDTNAGGYTIIKTDAGRPCLVMVVFGDEDVNAVRVSLKGAFSDGASNAAAITPNDPLPVAYTIRPKAKKKTN